jgi:uncharacterized protein
VKVVCNSSPLIALLSVNKIDILNKLFGEVLIPEAVFNEVFKVENKEADFNKAKFLKVVRVGDRNLVKVLNVHLGLGESEVIALSLEKDLDRVILDDKQARKIAGNMDLKVIGTVGVLLLAKQKSLINSIKPLLLEMKEKVNFRISQSIIDKVDK